jgi:chromosome segregation ATPase
MSEEHVTAEMIDVLRQIHAEQKQTRSAIERLDGRLAQTNGTLENVEGRLAQTNAAVERVEGRLTQTNAVVEKVEGRLAQTNEALEKVDRRLGSVEDELINFRRETREERVMVHAGQKDILTELRGLRGEVGTEVVRLEDRVAKLEAAVFPKPPRPARRAGARR